VGCGVRSQEMESEFTLPLYLHLDQPRKGFVFSCGWNLWYHSLFPKRIDDCMLCSHRLFLAYSVFSFFACLRQWGSLLAGLKGHSKSNFFPDQRMRRGCLVGELVSVALSLYKEGAAKDAHNINSLLS